MINLRALYFNKEREDEAFFCSSLVAACYKAAGLLPREIPENEYSPALFSGEGESDALLPLRHCRLGPLREVVVGAAAAAAAGGGGGDGARSQGRAGGGV